MIRIDNPVIPNFQDLTQVQSQNQVETPQGQVVSPTLNTSALIAEELMDTSSETLAETMEEMSIGIGSMMRKMLMKGKEVDIPQMKQLESMLRELSEEQASSINKVTEDMAVFDNPEDILAHAQDMGLSEGQKILLLTSLAMSGQLGEKELKKLQEALQGLLAQEGSELALYATMETLPLSIEGFANLRSLYQRAQRGENGLCEWFNNLRNLPDRRRRIKVLLRALSEPLADEAGSTDITKLAAVIKDLRQLLIFLTIEEHSMVVAKFFHLDSEDILARTLEVIEQSWIYPQSLDECLKRFNLPKEKEQLFLQRWRGLVSLVHDDCFRDQEHKEHVDEVFVELLDIADEES
ncbi:MAG: TyeA family type III secretion system gatekeeper subunit [Enterobacteriaceae bacterium]